MKTQTTFCPKKLTGHTINSIILCKKGGSNMIMSQDMNMTLMEYLKKTYVMTQSKPSKSDRDEIDDLIKNFLHCDMSIHKTMSDNGYDFTWLLYEDDVYHFQLILIKPQ